MPLIACPDCEKPISDIAPACIHCGRPMAAPVLAGQAAAVDLATAATPPPTPAPSALACPNCRSEDTRRLSMIWREGLASTSGNTVGVGAGGGGLGAGVASSIGTFQTVASKGAAPPEEKGTGGPGCALFAGVMLVLVAFAAESPVFGLFAFIIILFGGLFLHEANQFNEKEYPELRRHWEHSYRCQRCENIFEVA